MTTPTILVVCQVPHSGMKRGQRYRLPYTDDVAERIAARVLRPLEPTPEQTAEPTAHAVEDSQPDIADTTPETAVADLLGGTDTEEE